MSSSGVFKARFYNQRLLKEKPKPGNDLGWTKTHIGTMVKIFEYIKIILKYYKHLIILNTLWPRVLALPSSFFLYIVEQMSWMNIFWFVMK
jgi:hypothetical protein